MERTVDELADLGQGQTVRLELGDEDALEARVNQISYTPDDHLRLELSADDERYQLGTAVEDGAWTPIEVRKRDRDGWTATGRVTEVLAGETFRVVTSEDMKAQQDTGTGG